MDFSANKQDTYEKRIASLPDQPNMQPNELKAYFDSSPEQLRQAHTGLCDALTEATSNASAAANLGFQRTAGVPADDVQAAVENVQAQLDAAVMGNIPSGSVDGDKLAQDVRDRFIAIENAARSEASTRSSGDLNLQNQINAHTTQLAAKCEVVFGSYNGNGQESQYISLGFAPKAVICSDDKGQIVNLSRTTGSIAFPGTKGGLQIEGNGFRAYYRSDIYWNNGGAGPYYYIAFK